MFLILSFFSYFNNQLIYANKESLNILVVSYEDKTNELKEIAEKVRKIIAEEIKQSGRYIYISEKQFGENWADQFSTESTETDDLFSEIESDLKNALRNLDENPEKIRVLFSGDDLGALSEHQHFWNVDQVIIGHLDKNKNDKTYTITSRIINIQNGRFHENAQVISEGTLAKFIKKQAQILLNKGTDLQKTYADNEDDHVMSVVSYKVEGQDGAPIGIVVDYTSFRPNPDIQNVKIVPPENIIKKGGKIIEINSREGKIIRISFFYDVKQLRNIKLDTDYPPNASQKGHVEELTVLSQGGYIIKFIFSWRNEKLINVRVEPLINPYCPIS